MIPKPTGTVTLLFSDIEDSTSRLAELGADQYHAALEIHRALQRQPLATAASLAAATKLTPATVNKALVHLERVRVVTELTRKQRGRVFSYARYVAILNEGMALPDSGSRA